MTKTATRRRRLRPVEFVCPRCGVDRIGTEIALRRWRYVAGVPFLPSFVSERIVVCVDCAHQCDTGALDIPTTAQLARMLEAATFSAAVAIVRATGDDQVLEVRDRSLTVLGDEGYDDAPDSLERALASHPDDVYLRRATSLRHELTPLGKRGLLHRLAGVASADLTPTGEQRRVLVSIGRALGLDVASIDDVLTPTVHATADANTDADAGADADA